jgi:hypothetical protein
MPYETHRRIQITDPLVVYTFNFLYVSTILYVFYRAAIADDHLEKTSPLGTVIFPTPENHVAPELHQTLHSKVLNPAVRSSTCSFTQAY